jgi:hypothetical protein
VDEGETVAEGGAVVVGAIVGESVAVGAGAVSGGDTGWLQIQAPRLPTAKRITKIPTRVLVGSVIPRFLFLIVPSWI